MKKSLRKLLIEQIDVDIIKQVQSIIDNNEYLKGNMITEKSLSGSRNYVLWASEEGLQHIKDRHMDINAPGSLFAKNLDIRKMINDILELPPNHLSEPPKIKWMEIEMPFVTGYSGLRTASPQEIAKMKDYTMPRGGEVVKVAPGKREPTKYISLVTRKIGKLSDGRDLLSLITLYPGADTIDGIKVPSSRREFTDAGFYFSLPSTSPILGK